MGIEHLTNRMQLRALDLDLDLDVDVDVTDVLVPHTAGADAGGVGGDDDAVRLGGRLVDRESKL